MAGSSKGRGIALFVLFLFVMGPYVSLVPPAPATLLSEAQGADLVSEGTPVTVDVRPGQISLSPFELDVPTSTGAITSLDMTVQSATMENSQTLLWEGDSSWNHVDANHNNTFSQAGILSGDGSAPGYDFNNGAQGWTFSNSYSTHWTSQSCGYNGSSGGSLRTYAGSTHATSPATNLAGRSNIPFHAWVHEGRSGCGETPDSGENLQLKYKTANGQWTTFHTFQGGGSQTSNFQYSTTLPVAALHSTSQFRIQQTSGSGTCCDYWFVDDVKVVIPPTTAWTSPTFGYNTSNSFSLAEGPYAPMHINADMPLGSTLHWTLIDAQTGDNISGFESIEGTRVHLDAVDWERYGSLRVRLMFEGLDSNSMPSVESISAGGLVKDTFSLDPTERGWTLNNSTYLAGAISSVTNGTVHSPWFTSNSPLATYQIAAVMQDFDAFVRHAESDPWTSISLPYSGLLSPNEHAFQIMFMHNSSQPALLNQVQVTMSSGQRVHAPTLDMDGDGLLEWGDPDVRIGSWGFQDHFSTGEKTHKVSFGFSGLAEASAWIPASNLERFAVSVSSENGNMTGMSLRIAGSTILSRTLDNETVFRLELNASEQALLEATLNSQSALLNNLGQGFALVELEVYGKGVATFSNLAAPYATMMTISADQQSPLVMAANSAYRTPGSTPSIAFPFTGLSNGKLIVEVTDMEFSDEVAAGMVTMENASTPLTTSQRWLSFTTRFSIDAARSVSLIRLDVQGQNNHATWLLPTGGGAALGQGDSSLVELHPTDSFNISEISATMSEITVKFRIEQGWDDEDWLTASMRLVLDNSVISRPGQYMWSGIGGGQALENDLAVKSVEISGDHGLIDTSTEYLAAGMGLNFSIDVGYEGIDGIDAFADGDAEVQLWQGNTMVANTTSLDVDMWNVSDVAPFSFGDLTWTVRVIPLNGGDIINESEYTRTFKIDPTSPAVIASTVEWYDHRLSSPSQTVQFQILDPVLLPSDVHVMLWREWADDVDLNGWPSPDEYKERSLLIPTDLTLSTGIYTLLFDDSMGSQGQKVAGYLVGMDASGQILEDAGTAEEGEHLFMYQIGPDGPPTLSATAMSWTGGAKPWLHPSQTYTLGVDMREPNGASDLTTVEIQLGVNILTSPLSFTWDFRTDSCTSDSVHLIIHDCHMLALDGTAAGPYEKDTRLVTELELAWTTPDLGDTFREPSVKIIDRAGQEVLQTFPALRWRFSPALTIPQETVSLVLTQGTVLDDGARIPPNSQFELTGGLVFEATEETPDFNCSVDIMFAGQIYTAQTYDGIWNVELQSPPASGTIPLTWSVGCLPPQGIDATEEGSSVKWMVVDGLGPEPQEVQTPRPGSILSAQEHEVTIVLSEEGGIDFESLRLAWWVEDTVTGELIREGNSPFLLQGTEISGLSLVGTGTMDLSVITDDMLIDRFTVFVLVEGRDLAGNLVLGGEGQSAGNAITSWLMEWRQPEFELETPAMEYSRLNLQTGDSTAVQIFVKNVGTLDGTTDATISVVRADGTSEVLRQTEVEIAEGGIGTILIDWAPEKEGLQWIEVVLENGATGNGPSVDVRPTSEPSFSESIFGDVNPVLGSIGALLGISIILALLVMARNATVRRGSKSEYEWDEYSDYLDEDEDDYIDDDADLNLNQPIKENTPVETAGAQTTTSTQATSADGWTQGSDGVWWWQNQEDGSWWYKDANGEILQYK
ncbi:MAG: hypothetical protein CMA41_05075 [Euryarchaeota archaeon]|nr:hypothetical protein [Euryarchaeota archaeon]